MHLTRVIRLTFFDLERTGAAGLAVEANRMINALFMAFII